MQNKTVQLLKSFNNMVGHSRYDVSEKEAGMNGNILKNKLGLKDQLALGDAETILLADAYDHFFGLLKKGDLTLDLPFLFEIHRYFLSPLYSWAGQIREVDLSKNGVLFAAAKHLAQSVKTSFVDLRRHMPTLQDSKRVVAHKLAFIHNELNALHPFREGNGRAIRLFLDLLAVYVGFDPIDWKQSSTDAYIEACRVGMAGKHKAMERIIFRGIRKNAKNNSSHV